MMNQRSFQWFVWFKLIGAYIVAVKLGDVTSSNLFMDEVFRRLSYPEKEHSYGVVRNIPTVYRRTQEGSPLCKIFAGYTAHKMTRTSSNDTLER